MTNWQDLVADVVDDRPIRYMLQTYLPEEYRVLVNEAARRRGIPPAHYFRRAVLSFVAHDLDLPYEDLMTKEPPIRESESLPPRRFGGTGFGKWNIRRLW